jgi:hypothetical protein
MSQKMTKNFIDCLETFRDTFLQVMGLCVKNPQSVHIYFTKHYSDSVLKPNPDVDLRFDAVVVNKANRKRRLWMKIATQESATRGQAAFNNIYKYLICPELLLTKEETMSLIFLSPKNNQEFSIHHKLLVFFLEHKELTLPINYYYENDVESLTEYCYGVCDFIGLPTRERIW